MIDNKTEKHHPAELDLIQAGTEVCSKIQQAGFQAFFVGGAVRNHLIQQPIHEIDIASDIQPHQISTLFPNIKFVGAKFGVSIITHNDIPFEVATFRKDGKYADNRRPESIEYGTLEDDAFRRDFTINAIYQNPVTKEIIDLTGGREDLKNKILRCVGNPDERLEEDSLRLLRAIRFASQFDLGFDQTTFDAIKKNGFKILNIAAERVRDEITRMLMGENPAQAVRYLYITGLLKHILPEIHVLHGLQQPAQYHAEGDVFTHSLLALQYLEPKTPLNVWATLLHDIGKSQTQKVENDKISFHNHENVGSEIAKNVLDRLRFPNHEYEIIVQAVRHHMHMHLLKDMRKSKVRKLLALPSLEVILDVNEADCKASGKKPEAREFIKEFVKEIGGTTHDLSLPKPLVNGHDLIALGMKPGIQLGRILKRIHDDQLDQIFGTKEEGIQLARHLIQMYEMNQ